jgi:cell division protein FtsL
MRRAGIKMIRRLLAVLLMLVGVVLLGLFYVWERATSMQLTLLLAKEEKKLEVMEGKIEELRMDYLQLTSVIRVEEIAREQLGMRYPTGKEIRYIRIE